MWNLDKKKKKKKNNRFDESARKYQVAMKREKENGEIGRKFLFNKKQIYDNLVYITVVYCDEM